MSFLIEDILNTKNSYQKNEIENIVENAPVENRIGDIHVDRQSNCSDQSSILHQTLVNRLNSPYHRGSESHHGLPLENFQHFCYDPAYLNYYRTFYERGEIF